MTAIKEQVGRDAIEHASVDEIRNVQLERLKWTLKHAYDNVPHYRQKFDEAGVHPDDLKQLSDISKFPFTTKQDLRDNYPFKMFAVPREQVARVHASRHHGQAYRGWLYRQGHFHLGRLVCPFHVGGRCPSG